MSHVSHSIQSKYKHYTLLSPHNQCMHCMHIIQTYMCVYKALQHLMYFKHFFSSSSLSFPLSHFPCIDNIIVNVRLSHITCMRYYVAAVCSVCGKRRSNFSRNELNIHMFGNCSALSSPIYRICIMYVYVNFTFLSFFHTFCL